MFRWVRINLNIRNDKPDLNSSVKHLVMNKAHIALYYTPERGWYGYASAQDDLPNDNARLRTVMDSRGILRSITTDVLLRAAEAVRGEFPDETLPD